MVADHARVDAFLEGLEGHLSAASIETVRAILSNGNGSLWNLRLTPREELFNDDELATLRSLPIRAQSELNALHKQTVIILKATRLCNLRCTYCNAWREGPGQIMEFPILAKLIKEVLETTTVENAHFVWHGGEVTLLKPSYLEKALWLQEKFSGPQVVVENSIQTNATRLTPEWLRFLKKYRFGVGVSLDGPPEIHDQRRLTVSGQGSWRDVKKGIDSLREWEIPFGALAVIDECALTLGARAYLQYLADVGITQVALLNALPPNSDECAGTAEYLPHDRFTAFLTDLFRAWWHEFRDRLMIRELESLVEAVIRGRTALCIFNDNCMGQYLTIDPNGDVSACDKYVGDPDYMFGNIATTEINEMLRHSQLLRAARADVSRQKREMSACPNYSICFGGCPHDVRLSEKYRPAWRRDCCGLSDLIDEISLAVASSSARTSEALS